MRNRERGLSKNVNSRCTTGPFISGAAHPKILDKFLQILDDGQLTSGKGKQSLFSLRRSSFSHRISAWIAPTRRMSMSFWKRS